MTLPNNHGITVPLHAGSLHYWLLIIGFMQAAIAVSNISPLTPDRWPEDISGVAIHSFAAICFTLAGLLQKRTVRISGEDIAMTGAIMGNDRAKIIPGERIQAIDELPKKFLVFYTKRPNQWTETLVIPKKHLSKDEIISLRNALRQLEPAEAHALPID